MEEPKTKEKENPNLMKRVLLSTLSFGVLLFIVYIVNDIISDIPYKCLTFAESDSAKFFQYLISIFSWDVLSFPLILTIRPLIGFFITIAVLSLTLKQRVPVATAVLSVLIFWLIYQQFWSRATDPDPYGAAMLFFIISPFIGGFSGVVAFLPMFFVENYLIKKTREKKYKQGTNE